MVNLVEAIAKGIEGKYEYLDPSFSDPITYRAITLWEHELAHQNALETCDDLNIVKMIVGAGKKAKDQMDLDNDQYKQLRKYQFDLMLWICYYGLKDFQPEGFSIETLKKLYIDIQKLSVLILQVSTGTREQIVEVIKNKANVELAYIIHVLNIPLVSEAWKLTPLQVEYLINSKRHIENPQPEGVVVTKEQIEKDPQKYRKELEDMFGVGKRSKRWRS